MSMASHIAELERRHTVLEKQIEANTHSPASDPLKLAELKRKKLKLKDEIEKLRLLGSPPTVH
jgi:hypothetical protein